MTLNVYKVIEKVSLHYQAVNGHLAVTHFVLSAGLFFVVLSLATSAFQS